MPAVAESNNNNMASKENKQSIKVLDDLMAKLNISKSQDEINAAAANVASFINGPIEEADAPTKYVYRLLSKNHSSIKLRVDDFEIILDIPIIVCIESRSLIPYHLMMAGYNGGTRSHNEEFSPHIYESVN